MRFAGVVALLLVLSLEFAPAADATPASSPSPRWTYHRPIVIVGNANFTAANGVTGGSGSPSDPYLVAGWDLDANSTDGVRIQDTTASFVLRDSFVHGATYGLEGVRLENVTHGLVTNMTFAEYAQLSVVINSSSYVDVTSSALTGEDPLAIGGSHDCGVYNNTVTNTALGTGITVSGSTRVSVLGNHVKGGSRGIMAYSSNNVTIEDNTVVGAYWFSLSLTFSTAITVRRNVMVAYDRTGPSGIEMNVRFGGDYKSDADSHTITPDNTVGGFPVLYYRDCRNVTIDGMRLGQLILAGCQGIVVSNVTLGFPYWGYAGVLTIIQSWDWTFTRNTFYGLWIYHIGVHGDQDGRFYLNNIYGVGLDGNPLHAGLNASYPLGGNYWAGYQGEDRCSGASQDVCPDPDGFGDTPAVIDYSAGIVWIGTDAYPWMNPIDLANTPPIADSVVAPAEGTPSTAFVFNASASSDAQDPSGALEVRWDWNGDGIWDTGWSTNKSASHAFPSAGTHTVVLEVRDTEGWLALTSFAVVVHPEPYAFLSETWFVLLVAAIFLVAVVLFLRSRRRPVRALPEEGSLPSDETRPKGELPAEPPPEELKPEHINGL